MPAYGYVVVIAATLFWAAPFPLVMFRQKGGALTLDRRARWGVALQCVGYTLLWQGSFWTRSPAPWQLALSIAFFAVASLLSWTSTRALGGQLRVDAALDQTHQLIRRGPYRFVRHPIYTSMLCVLIGTGLLVTPPFLFLAAIVVFLLGTEIRMRIEDTLLAARFADQFEQYRRSVPRLLPFVKI